MKPTKIYGQSDDLIEFEGGVYGEVGFYADGDSKALIACSDGTMLSMLRPEGIWKIEVLKKGSLFASLEICTDEDADMASDVAHFAEGLKYAYVATGGFEEAK